MQIENWEDVSDPVAAVFQAGFSEQGSLTPDGRQDGEKADEKGSTSETHFDAGGFGKNKKGFLDKTGFLRVAREPPDKQDSEKADENGFAGEKRFGAGGGGFDEKSCETNKEKVLDETDLNVARSRWADLEDETCAAPAAASLSRRQRRRQRARDGITGVFF